MTFVTIKTAREITSQLYPEAKNVNFVEHGYDNIVALIDEKYAVRFPKFEGAYIRSKYERQVLLDLSSLKTVAIPRILGKHDDPPYMITSFLRGKHLSSNEINQLTVEQQEAIGEKVAQFAFEMHSILPPAEALRLRNEFKLDEQPEEPWERYFINILIERSLPTTEQDSLAKSYYHEFKNLKYTTPTIVVHDDLHNENMLFEDGQLIGILDFGDTNIGTPEQEFRQLYRINQTVLEAAIETYEKFSGQKLNVHAIKIWAIIQELAAYADKLHKNNTDHPAFVRATQNLNKWLPEGNWGVDDEQNSNQIISKQ